MPVRELTHQKTHSSFYIDKTNERLHGSHGARHGPRTPACASGQAGFDFGVFRNQDANSRLYYNIPIAIRDTINYVIFSPIDQCEFNPDVVVFVGDSDMADIVMRATSYISGDLWESKSSSVLSCAWTYMYTWLSGKVNHCQTGMHHGMGRRKVYPKSPYRFRSLSETRRSLPRLASDGLAAHQLPSERQGPGRTAPSYAQLECFVQADQRKLQLRSA